MCTALSSHRFEYVSGCKLLTSLSSHRFEYVCGCKLLTSLSSHRFEYVSGCKLLQRLPCDALHDEPQHDHREVTVASGRRGGVPQAVRQDEGYYLRGGRGEGRVREIERE